MKSIFSYGFIKTCIQYISAVAVVVLFGEAEGQQIKILDMTRYVRESTVTYFGMSDERYQKLTTRTDISICDVKYKSGVFISDEHSMTFTGNSNDPKANPAGLTHAVIEYSMASGRKAVFPNEDFVSEMPYVGFELFYLPMLHKNKDSMSISNERIIAINSAKQLSPAFKGAWTYENESRDGFLRISGPVVLETKHNECLMCGTILYDVTLEPFQVVRTSGDILIHIRPSGADLLPNSQTRLGKEKWFEDYTEVVGHFRYRLVPIDSVEAKKLTIPSELSRAVQAD